MSQEQDKLFSSDDGHTEGGAKEGTSALLKNPSSPPIKPSPNDICNSCLKWAQFGENCRVYWEGKKFCTMRVTTVEDWDSEHQLLKK